MHVGRIFILISSYSIISADMDVPLVEDNDSHSCKSSRLTALGDERDGAKAYRRVGSCFCADFIFVFIVRTWEWQGCVDHTPGRLCCVVTVLLMVVAVFADIYT